MALNLEVLGNKLFRYRSQFKYSIPEVSQATGIPESRLQKFEKGLVSPSGDEILIISDFYKCDYKFFLSNEKLASFEETEILFRKFNSEFSKVDRWSVQEFLFLAECEAYLEHCLLKPKATHFKFKKTGTYYKAHGKGAAHALRNHLKYSTNDIVDDIYHDMRSIGIRVFRRKLENSNISGLYINHSVAGKCVLINYNEDVYRQRFTAAHEMAHTILDDDDDVSISLASWDKKDLKEVRANTFASAYLLPPESIERIEKNTSWTTEKSIFWARKLKVSTLALANALSENKLITRQDYTVISNSKVPKEDKQDPELPDSLTSSSKVRKQALLEHGLSSYYVALGFAAYRERKISASRLAEMLLLESDYDLYDFSKEYGESI